MRNIKIVLAYDGADYAGWQRQKNVPTIQGIVEEKIGVMTGAQVVLHGAGRTDAGVHALGMTANFKTHSDIPATGFLKGLNSLLPEDIRVLDVQDIDPDFHARYNARGKAYLYVINAGMITLPTERLYTCGISRNLDLNRIRDCLKILIGKHDFSSFEATGSRDLSDKNGKGAIREIFSAECVLKDNETGKIFIKISGDGFLRHMVRNIAGTLIEVGIGKMSVTDFKRALDSKNRSAAGPTAPARGLFLKKVFY